MVGNTPLLSLTTLPVYENPPTPDTFLISTIQSKSSLENKDYPVLLYQRRQIFISIETCFTSHSQVSNNGFKKTKIPATEKNRLDQRTNKVSSHLV